MNTRSLYLLSVGQCFSLKAGGAVYRVLDVCPDPRWKITYRMAYSDRVFFSRDKEKKVFIH